MRLSLHPEKELVLAKVDAFSNSVNGTNDVFVESSQLFGFI